MEDGEAKMLKNGVQTLNDMRKCAVKDPLKPEGFCRVDCDPAHTVIHPMASIGHRTRVGLFSVIEKGVSIGNNCAIGNHTQISTGVRIGNNVKIGNGVTLKTGTRIGDDSIVDDHCITTGACWIGDCVNVRTGAIISKATVIENFVFIGPGVVTNHTKHVGYGRPKVNSVPLLTIIGFGAIIGSQVALVAGLEIAPLTIIGAGSVVTKNIEEPAIYAGNPLRRLKELPLEYVIDGPGWYPDEAVKHFERYMPELDISALREVCPS